MKFSAPPLKPKTLVCISKHLEPIQLGTPWDSLSLLFVYTMFHINKNNLSLSEHIELCCMCHITNVKF